MHYLKFVRLILLLSVFSLISPVANAEIAYDLELKWEADEAVQALLLAHAEQAFLKNTEPVSSFNHLRRRAGRDMEYFHSALRALGFYADTSSFDIERDTDPPKLTYTLVPGPRYTFQSFEYLPAADDIILPELPVPEKIGCHSGEPAEASVVNASKERLISHMRGSGHPFAAVPRQQVVVDHAVQQVRVAYFVDPGKFAVFGKIEVSGLQEVRPEVVDKEVPWDAGDVFDGNQLSELRTRLYKRNLFSVARVRPGDTVDAEGRLPVVVEIQEGKLHTFSTGVNYASVDGPGVKVQWTDRNRRGMGNKLHLSLELSQRDMRLKSDYTIYRFARDNQTLTVESEFGQEDTDAYTSQTALSRVWLSREVSPHLTLGLGLGMRISQVTRNRETESYFLLSTPFQWNYDRSNDKFDPTGGFRLAGRAGPYLSVADPANSFFKADSTFSHYLGFGDSRAWVLATRVRTGFVLGGDRKGVPPDLLFYSGGGGSIRGYAYQAAGPLDADDDPLGGLSVFETSIELRRRISKNIGMAVFLEGGTVFDSPCPDFSEDILWAAGTGIRYYTPLGPLRADIAVPLNKRDSDSALQFYISIGQAF